MTAGSLPLVSIIDGGAADVIIPNVMLTLMRFGTISDDDYPGAQTYKLANAARAKLPSPLPVLVDR
jgi:hypothetical protein